MHPKHIPSSNKRVVNPHLSRSLFQRCMLLWEQPTWSVLLVLPLYTFLAVLHGSLWHASKFAYFNYLADAFLHGQLYLRLTPASTHDLILFDGRYYLYWPPFPAILLMPFVAGFGVQFSDIIFTLGIAASNVSLVALILRQACRRSVIRLSRLQRGLLVMFFALGTVHITLAPYGRVWLTGQLVGFFCLALAYLAALTLERRPAFALTGLMLAGTLFTRNHMVFAGLWPACYLFHRHRLAGRWPLFINSVIGVLPIALTIGLLGLYNWLRFGSVFDNGMTYSSIAGPVVSDFQRYGSFNLHCLPANLFYQYLAYPFPVRPATFYGGSLFLLSPVFCASFRGLTSGRTRWPAWALLVTILFVAAPTVLVPGGGWVQFGPRYTLDFTVPLLLLTAMGVRQWHTRTLALLTVLSIVQYLFGTIYLGAHLAWIDRL